MKYKTPELTALTSAIDAIQSVKAPPIDVHDSFIRLTESATGAYEDWE